MLLLLLLRIETISQDIQWKNDGPTKNARRGGAHHDSKATSDAMGKAIMTHLKKLQKLSPDELLEGRLAKYDAMGPFETV